MTFVTVEERPWVISKKAKIVTLIQQAEAMLAMEEMAVVCVVVGHATSDAIADVFVDAAMDVMNGRKIPYPSKIFLRKAEIAKNYEHMRDGIYKLKKGGQPIVKGANYLQWDYLHSDVEVYQSPKRHLGSPNPQNLNLCKGPAAGRKISL